MCGPGVSSFAYYAWLTLQDSLQLLAHIASLVRPTEELAQELAEEIAVDSSSVVKQLP